MADPGLSFKTEAMLTGTSESPDFTGQRQMENICGLILQTVL